MTRRRLGALSAAMIDDALDWEEFGHSHDWSLADGIRQSAKNTDPTLEIRIEMRAGMYYIMVRKYPR